ncbi:UDP-N-acetylmuramoyl-L-alanyl-D-glutamate synthetase [Rugosibacter aromaticivorans]|uniref:UDP-N-acetylmuramoylalanine--D-glutamate ligase n=1 Tax=Rugosibacter aromaticivorans TaxID=1565605 RepID=A0A0C5J7P5_9PROT|nr:UDP-N-acetylmuramoyl-L-alanine--D-glutamate ligase [Rugosibacter aromaticivorans]AJP47644.1 UDP-N-acetylmuramoyl-L-alanyl-D-glutamate synthetase [Rugosibacter aromaticivorans]TBR12820.1 MAG: UDP-N-acetylmuramoyl-L-alanine--D-glutamate ligase [Rugosibacter sp.]
MSDLQGKHILVLGLGESGLASACWCAESGARVRVADTRVNPPYLAELHRRVTSADFLAGAFELHLLDGVDRVVLSPGLPGDLPIVREAAARGLPVVGEIELFARALRELNSPAPVLAITGTNGKTTTTALTGHLLRSMGQRVGVAGNISPAALMALSTYVAQDDLPQIWVLELSSFQLETTTSLQPAAATVLNISDDHLDRYDDLAAYAAVKARIFQGAGVQVVNRQDAYVNAMLLAGRHALSFGLDAPQAATDFGLRQQAGELWLAQGEQFLLPVSELPVQGLHNAANVMAALALCASLGYDVQQLLPAVCSFQGLPHRVEKVVERDGVTWYDDSKGTNVGATVAALEGIGNQHDRKIVLIAGGDGKGQDFSPLASAVARWARAVVLIGRDGPLIGSVLENSGVPLVFATNMSDAVQQASVLAQNNDAVLLSPACASFDMFRDYQQRAEVFIAAVKNLAKATS